MATVFDVAQAFVEKFTDESRSEGRRTPPTGMQVQKLCYFAQGWAWAVLGRELFAHDFHAWRYGPVCPELFRTHKGEFLVESVPGGDSSRLTPNERVIIDGVFANYGALSGLQMAEFTHDSPSVDVPTPWRRVRDQLGVPDGESCDAVIPKEWIAEFFRLELELPEPVVNAA